jgi:hypothetical protein
MKQARAQFAGRVTASEAVYEHVDGRKVLKAPRRRERRPLGSCFRFWARTFRGRRDLSPKLLRIVGGAS